MKPTLFVTYWVVLASAAMPAAQAKPSTATGAAIERVGAANRSALREPRADAYANARQIYAWSDGAIFQVYAAPEFVSDIALQPGEEVISVAAGDTARWVIGDTTSGSGKTKRTHLLIKPTGPSLRTNLVVATDRRTYHLALSSTGGPAMAAVSWTYPHDELLALQRKAAEAQAAAPVASGVAIEELNFTYAISGDRPPWRPLRVFDDGRQVYIQFPAALAQGQAPPLFLLGSKGEAQLVNYRIRGHYYVVDRLFDRAELRLGEKRQQIVRISRGAELTRRRAGR